MLVGEYMLRAYGGRYYGRAHNLARLLSESYDQAFARVDILASPTLPFPPPRQPATNATREEVVGTAFGMTINTAPFNATGHPSMSMPCGWIDGLPVGLMLTGRRFDERLLYRAASSLEPHWCVRGSLVPKRASVPCRRKPNSQASMQLEMCHD